jgi:hypothetical protein
MVSYLITHNVKAPFTGAHGDGTVEVSTDNAKLLWPGAKAVIGSDTKPEVEVLILEDIGSGKFRVRLNNTFDNNAGGPVTVLLPCAGSDFSAYIVADAAYIHQFAGQCIFFYPHEGVIPRTPSALSGGQ